MSQTTPTVLSIFFGDHDSNVAVGTADGRLVHLEAERYFRRKHLRATADEMNELIEVALVEVGVRDTDVTEVLLASWGSQYDLAAPVRDRRDLDCAVAPS